MKKTILFILGISFILVVNSCKNNESDENDTQDTTENVQDVQDMENTVDVVENDNDDKPETEGIELKAKFDGIYLGTGGTTITFKGEDGNDYDFYDDGNEQVHKMFEDVDPTDPNDMTYIGDWYNLTYKSTTIERYNGASGEYYDDEVLVIVAIEAEK